MCAYRRLDLAATNAAGYDDIFKQPAVIDDGSQFGQSARTESAEIRVPGQIEPALWDRLEMGASGNMPDTKLVIIHHFSDLESLGLVGSDGNVTLKVGDRLAAIYEKYTGNVVHTVADPPGLYIVRVGPSRGGIGLSSRRNLLEIELDERDRGIT